MHQHHIKNKTNRFPCCSKEWFAKTNSKKKGFQIDLKVLSMKLKRDFSLKIAQFLPLL